MIGLPAFSARYEQLRCSNSYLRKINPLQTESHIGIPFVLGAATYKADWAALRDFLYERELLADGGVSILIVCLLLYQCNMPTVGTGVAEMSVVMLLQHEARHFAIIDSARYKLIADLELVQSVWVHDV